MNEVIYILELAEKHTIFGLNMVALAFFFCFFAGLLKLVEWMMSIISWVISFFTNGIDDIVWRRKMAKRWRNRIN